MHKSLWEIPIESFPKLEKNEACDVCIIGGGLTGISLAYYLKDSGLNIVLIEQGKIASSTTLKTTAKLTYLQKDILSKIQKYRGEKLAKRYYESQKKAVQDIKHIIEKEEIECNLEASPSYLFVKDKKNLPKLKKEFSLYKNFGANVVWSDRLPMSNKKIHCCSVSDTYVFHPLKYLNGLLEIIEKEKHIQIYENTRMIDAKQENDRYIIYLENGKQIRTNKLVFAGHYPPFLFPYLFPIKANIKKELVLVRKEKNYNFNAINLDKDICSLRFYEDHVIQVIDSKKLNNKAILKQPAISNKKSLAYSWINYDIMTSDSLPIVGLIGSSKNNLYIATGYNGWGMTNSNLAGQILAKEILGEEHEYSELFHPYRKLTMPVFFNRFFNVFSNVYHFIGSYFPGEKSKAKIVWKDGKRMGVVIDENGVRHEVLLTCPHMKCGLLYNEKENTWDCPCHGSRFDIDGNLIKGPATDCIKKD